MARRWLALHSSGLVALALAGRAQAHSVLVDSSLPLEAAIVKPKVEAHLTLHFSGGVQPRGSTLDLVPEHGDTRPMQLVFGPGPGDVALTLPPLAAGPYALRYHVIATDGHVTDGTVPFRVAPE